MSKIRIVLADDHKLVREGFKSLISKNSDLVVIGEAGNGEEVLELLNQHVADIILLDLSMPGLAGFDAVATILEKFPSVGIIILTMHEEAEYVIKCIQNGAKGYLLKSTEPEELVKAIQTVADGGKYFTPAVSQILLNNIVFDGQKGSRAKPLLSEREYEILKYISEGLSAKMIGDKLFISSRTVEKHKENIMEKLEVSNTAEMIKKAILEKIIS